MTALFVCYALACLAALVWLWQRGHPAILDPGDYDQPSVGAELRHPPADKVQHAAASALLTAVGAALNGWALFWPVVVALALGALWELAQWKPRKGGRGYADPKDFLFDALGALAVAVVVLVVRAVVR